MHMMRSEFKKLTTTRTFYLLLIGVGVIAAVTVLDPTMNAKSFQREFYEYPFVLFTSLLSRLLILVLGIRIITDEFRHGTQVPTFLVSPRRGRVLVAKAVTAAVAGLVMAALAAGVMTLAASFVASSEGATLNMDGAWSTFVGMLSAGALWGVLGVGLGALVKSQIAATVGGIVWLMMLEDVVGSTLGKLGNYMPGEVGLGLAIGPNGRALVIGAAILASYAFVVMLGGAFAVNRRDIT